MKYIFFLIFLAAYASACLECEANTIYTTTSYPDHSFIYTYNSPLQPIPPQTAAKGIIQDAWFQILTVMPSIIYNGSLYVPSSPEIRSDYAYTINLPQDYYNSNKIDGSACLIQYSLQSKTESLSFKADNQLIGSSKRFTFSMTQDSLVEGTLTIQATEQARHYAWDKYCCAHKGTRCIKYCYDCRYSGTTYTIHTLELKDQIQLKHYSHELEADFQLISSYYGSSKGILIKDDDTSLTLRFNDSLYKEQEFEYSAEYLEYPFLTLRAEKIPTTKTQNLIRDNDTIFVKDAGGCSIEYSDFFKTRTKECNLEPKGEEIREFQKTSLSKSWNFLYFLAVFIFINILLYVMIKKHWGRLLTPFLLVFLFIPAAHAEDCGLTNLASCIPEKAYDFVVDLLNAPLQPLLGMVRTLMENPPVIDIFHGVWAIMVYCISLFYGFLFMYSGLQFLFSGHNVIRREMAKEWLKNTVIMMTLIQASFYLYGLVLELGAVMASTVLSMVDEHFFMITADNLSNMGLEFLFLTFYVLTLFITIILLLIRYLMVSFGVIYVPVGIFCYFVPPLRSYGKLILHMLGTFIFIVFFDAVIILGSSMLIELPIFANVKMLVMVACFTIINVIHIILTVKAVMKAVFSSGHGENIVQAVKYVGMMG